MKVTSSLERIANSCLLTGVSDDWELACLWAVTKAAEGCQGEQRHPTPCPRPTITENGTCGAPLSLALRFLIKKIPNFNLPSF